MTPDEIMHEIKLVVEDWGNHRIDADCAVDAILLTIRDRDE